MSIRILLLLILGAITYMCFHYYFFQYTSNILNEPKLSRKILIITYCINYFFFIILTRFALHLLANWALICILFVIEVKFLFHKKLLSSMIIAMDGAIIGLSTNIFTRCITAIFLERPLSHFDNNVYLSTNIKIYPISIAFLLAGIVLLHQQKSETFEDSKLVFKDHAGMKSLIVIKFILYLFLLVNLFSYYTDGDSLGLKLWGIKTSIFVLICNYVALYYISRLSKVRLFQEDVRRQRETLFQQKQHEEKLKIMAFTDLLTNTYNRAYIEEIFAELEETNLDITLCFVDLDNLKIVNDTLGHLAGDHYLQITANLFLHSIEKESEYVFRYGGDEFVILYKQQSTEFVETRIKNIQKKLNVLSYSKNYPYHLSISYGIANRGEGKNLREVLDLADSRMYEYKRSHKN